MKNKIAFLTLIILSIAFTVNAQHTQKELDYDFSSLEPNLDAKTMEIHYSKHHKGYINKLNKAIEDTDYSEYDLETLQKNISKSTPNAIRNNAGGSWNHEFFWKILSPDLNQIPSESLMIDINKEFGSFDNFKNEFKKAALGQFGSGWAWLILQNGKLRITSTSNQENPLMNLDIERGIPLLVLDVWEHAYYLKFQNLRGDYIDNFFNVINWEYVSKIYEDEK